MHLFFSPLSAAPAGPDGTEILELSGSALEGRLGPSLHESGDSGRRQDSRIVRMRDVLATSLSDSGKILTLTHDPASGQEATLQGCVHVTQPQRRHLKTHNWCYNMQSTLLMQAGDYS